jgi:hypothetical protein
MLQLTVSCTCLFRRARSLKVMTPLTRHSLGLHDGNPAAEYFLGDHDEDESEEPHSGSQKRQMRKSHDKADMSTRSLFGLR